MANVNEPSSALATSSNPGRAHAAFIATVFNEFCCDDLEDTSAAAVIAAAADSAIAFDRAVASTQAACVSTGKDFSCASAIALAEAWAATTEAHATAVAAAAGGVCLPCQVPGTVCRHRVHLHHSCGKRIFSRRGDRVLRERRRLLRRRLLRLLCPLSRSSSAARILL